MRKQQLTMFVPLLVFVVLVVAAAAQTPASQPASQRSELERVNVVRGTDDIRVVISARGAVTPKLNAIDSPARIVVDLPETVMASGQSRISVGSDGVKDVRIGMDGKNPPTTRVVVDLEHAVRYDLNPSADGKLVLTLYTQPATTAVNANASTIAPTKIVPSETVAPVVAPAAATATSDFVFVEPTYEAKKTAPEAVSEPAARSQEAAAKLKVGKSAET